MASHNSPKTKKVTYFGYPYRLGYGHNQLEAEILFRKMNLYNSIKSVSSVYQKLQSIDEKTKDLNN